MLPKPAPDGVLGDGYDVGRFYDEAFEPGPDGAAVPRPHYAELMAQIAAMEGTTLRRAVELANRSFLHRGVTFTVYADGEQGTERILPFDPIPRIVPAAEWEVIEGGLRQRIRALNLFVHDVYHRQEILHDGIVPRQLVVLGRHFRREVVGIDVPDDQYIHVAGSDLIRGDDGRWLVLEDNLRTPSGVSYVLANRQIMTRTFPDWFAELGVRSVDSYAGQLRDNLADLSPRRAIPGAASGPGVVVLTPGIYNSAYFEHAFLAQQMGVELVEGRDLFVLENRVYMRTTSGRRQVDVIYRRVDDEFLDPLAFRAESMLGVAGLLGAVRTGNVTLANAIGTGIADDKVLYRYVPAIIRYYLGEEPILDNVPTFLPSDPEQLDHVLANLDSLVVKAANESGGYGMLIGPAADEPELEEFRRRIVESPRNYIAQPVIPLSRHPTFVPDESGESGALEGRHVDLRPYALSGPDGITVLPGGLTRVALVRDSLVVNSSQGGGSKDTWVLQ
ncbi:MAG TPA: circularly permuted type 2 ATP-grasp protein [Gaiellaceae bacterium]|nr:circularly permuted type 2 ATP-grasp protein [Gaiellaceae bacterium]